MKPRKDVKYELTSLELLTTTAETLQESVAKLTKAAADMQQYGMKSAYFQWNARQWTAISIVTELCGTVESMMPEQILAKKLGRPSMYESAKKRTVRDESKKKAKESATAATTTPTVKKPVGRPRKKTT